MRTYKTDVGEFLVPDPAVLVRNFNIADFNGKWFITSGLNPTFDVFDCQLHEFHIESNKLVGNLSWRIRTPDGGFFTRSAVQRFVQEPTQPGILYNHDNEYFSISFCSYFHTRSPTCVHLGMLAHILATCLLPNPLSSVEQSFIY